MTAPDQVSGAGTRVLVAGTGGQGVLTAARLLCDCFVDLGHEVVSGQLHGMAQRGGAVQSSIIIDGGTCPVIAAGQADFVVGLEPVETVRALPVVSEHTWVYMNTAPIIPYVVAQRAARKEADASYPDVDGLIAAMHAATSNVLTLDATACAIEAGSAKALNMVMLGCLLGTGSLPCSADTFWEAAVRRMPPKLHDTNSRAFRAGVAMTAERANCGGAA